MEDQNSDKLHNQEDVNPTSQLDKLAKDNDAADLPETNGTGSNRPVPTSGSVIVEKEDDEDQDSNDIEQLGHS
ncbi:hypothetical protein SAMN06265348_101208 [Pedobacter westerhofensis]|uniref:Uncharacterized protein n=1 Tax=Pedobacter westerhofensis TaxID=425512 RepID=A0A521AHP8_9SPHI|nr:hypothetical protein [Pedobacter westerhofensis]SMO34317.1 hypothetical protein SAMN06265348_101208 [Pedobacter westerhofensis]